MVRLVGGFGLCDVPPEETSYAPMDGGEGRFNPVMSYAAADDPAVPAPISGLVEGTARFTAPATELK